MAELVTTKIVVRHFPDRAKPCLCIEQGNQAMIIATFKNKQSEELFCEFLGGNCIQRFMRRIFEDGGGEE